MAGNLLEIIDQEINGFINEDDSKNSGYYIGTGGAGKRFTLRHWYIYKDSQGEEKVSDTHVETYGQDLEKAKEQAKATLGYVPEVRNTEVGKIVQRLTYQHMPNGKYEGKLFSEVPLDYLTWWMEKYEKTPSYQKIIADIKAFIEEKTSEEIAKYTKITFGKYAGKELSALPVDYLMWLMQGSNNPIVRGAAKLELEKRGEVVDGRFKADIEKDEKEKKEQERRSGSGYVGNIGDKVTLELQVVNEFAFESQWGTTYITKFLDRNGNTVLYKGKQFIPDNETKLQVKNAYKISGNKLVEIPNPYENQYFEYDRNQNHTINLPGIAIPVDYSSSSAIYAPEGGYRGQGPKHFWVSNNAYGDKKPIADKVGEFLKQHENLEEEPFYDKIWAVDTNGIFYTFDQTRIKPFDKGDWIIVSGTISQHTEYKGEKQTAIQRPKFIKKIE